MKTILITVGEDIIGRNILFTSFWPSFKENKGDIRLIFVVHPDRVDYYKRLFSGPNVLVEGYKRNPPTRLENIVMSLARSGIDSKTNLWSKMRSYKRGDSSLVSTVFKRLHAATLGNLFWYKTLLRKIILLLPTDKKAHDLFERVKPDMVFCLSMTNFDFDVPIARETRKRKVSLLGMIRSWDNFSSHGLFRVVPDVLYLQNEFLKDMAFQYQAIPRSCRIELVGIPHYDFYKNNSLLQSRESFCKEFNLDQNKKIIFWAAMGEFLFLKDG
jgi:hypothetical protein